MKHMNEPARHLPVARSGVFGDLAECKVMLSEEEIGNWDGRGSLLSEVVEEEIVPIILEVLIRQGPL